MNHPNEERLNDYLDELLTGAESLAVRRHLEECEDCRSTVDELRQIVTAAGALGDIEPARDLLPGIRRAVTRPRHGWMRWAAAAAVVGFVALLAALQLGNGSGGEDARIDTLLANFRAAEAEYVKAGEMLARGLEERRDRIDPETLALIDASLATIDAAIADVHAVLDREGLSLHNTQTLTALYNKKLDILMRASRLSS